MHAAAEGRQDCRLEVYQTPHVTYIKKKIVAMVAGWHACMSQLLVAGCHLAPARQHGVMRTLGSKARAPAASPSSPVSLPAALAVALDPPMPMRIASTRRPSPSSCSRCWNRSACAHGAHACTHEIHRLGGACVATLAPYLSLWHTHADMRAAVSEAREQSAARHVRQPKLESYTCGSMTRDGRCNSWPHAATWCTD